MTDKLANEKIKNYFKIFNPTNEETHEYLESLKFLEEKGDAYATYMLGCYYGENGRIDITIKELGKIINEKVNDDDYKGLAYDYLGTIYKFGELGIIDFDKAIYYYSKGIECGEINSYINLSDMNRLGQGCETNKLKSLELLYKALDVVNSDYENNKENLGYIYDSMADVYSDLGDYKKEYEVLCAAIEEYKKLSSHILLGWYDNIMPTFEKIDEIGMFDKTKFGFFGLVYSLNKFETSWFMYKNKEYMVDMNHTQIYRHKIRNR